MGWFSQLAYWKARRLDLVPADTTPNPTITFVTAGPTSTVITGTGFMAEKPRADAGTSFVQTVYFGIYPAASFTVDSATQITAVAPEQAPGNVTIVVNTSGGCAKGGDAVFTGQLGLTQSAPTYLVLGTP